VLVALVLCTRLSANAQTPQGDSSGINFPHPWVSASADLVGDKLDCGDNCGGGAFGGGWTAGAGLDVGRRWRFGIEHFVADPGPQFEYQGNRAIGTLGTASVSAFPIDRLWLNLAFGTARLERVQAHVPDVVVASSAHLARIGASYEFGAARWLQVLPICDETWKVDKGGVGFHSTRLGVAVRVGAGARSR
jgi:hypothetical protein